jgi:DNA-binding transcriptional ArsR family regulator
MEAASGDTDIARLASVLADPGRAKMLLALADGRALAASTLASEAGVAASTASVHLGKLVDAGLCRVEANGRHRYYHLAGPEVADLLESLARLAPVLPVRSLRDGTRAYAVRQARTCYDHLAGRLGTAVMTALLHQKILVGGDGTTEPGHADGERLSGPGRICDYRLTETGRAWMDDFGVKVPTGTRRPLIRYCIDWSEQRHHLAGAFGAALLARMIDLDWVRRSPTSRAVRITETGRAGLAETFDLQI